MAASSMAPSLLLLLLAAIAFTTAELHDRKPLVEPASSTSSAEQLLALAAVEATIAELRERGFVVEPASPTAEPEPEPEADDVEPAARRTYVIQLEPPVGGGILDAEAAMAWHLSFLPTATTSQGKPTLVYSYRRVFDGFAARLTEEELKEVSAKPGFVRSFEESMYRTHTTRH